MKVEPRPGWLETTISPPSSRAISRLIARPRPVPPYLRLVVPSACWKASKMMRCLSSAMPMPVSVTESAIQSRPGAQRRALGGADPERDAALFGELEGVREQVAQHLLQPLRVGAHGRRQGAVDLDQEVELALLGDLPEGALHVVAEVAEADLGDLEADRAGLDLGEVEDVVDEGEEVRAGGVDRLGELALLVREVAFRVLGQELRQDQQRVQRRAQLVAHVGEELRLVARGQRQLLGLLLERRLGERDLAVLGLDLALLDLEQARLLLQLLVLVCELVLLLAQELFRLPQRRGLLLQALVGLLELLLLALQLAGQELGLLEQPFGAHVRRDRVEHDADRLGELVEEGLVGLARSG